MSNLSDLLRQSGSTLSNALRTGVLPNPEKDEISSLASKRNPDGTPKYSLSQMYKAIDAHPTQKKDELRQYVSSLYPAPVDEKDSEKP